MKVKFSLFVVVLLFVSGCTRIHFDNGTPATVATNSSTNESWHHNFALSLYESSEPVDLQQRCANKEWRSVTTEVSFVNGLAGSAVNIVGPIWYPKTVTVKCDTVKPPLK